jgi:hypothetical protein
MKGGGVMKDTKKGLQWLESEGRKVGTGTEKGRRGV